MAHTTSFVCLVSTVSGRSKNALGRGNTRSWQIAKHEQSRFSLDIYGWGTPALRMILRSLLKTKNIFSTLDNKKTHNSLIMQIKNIFFTTTIS
jgi:hypothetical protein